MYKLLLLIYLLSINTSGIWEHAYVYGKMGQVDHSTNFSSMNNYVANFKNFMFSS